MEKQKTLVLTSCLLLSLCSCVNSDIRKNLSQMLDHKIVIPYEQLEKRDCSYFRDSVKEGRTLTFVVYIDGNQCAPCELSDLSFMDRHYRNDTLWQKISKVYICDVSPANANALYSHLCNLRIENDVYFDTCHIFRKRNPLVPDSKMFHTFVLDREGNVKLVGNPFKNEKLKGLLKEVVEN